MYDGRWPESAIAQQMPLTEAVLAITHIFGVPLSVRLTGSSGEHLLDWSVRGMASATETQRVRSLLYLGLLLRRVMSEEQIQVWVCESNSALEFVSPARLLEEGTASGNSGQAEARVVRAAKQLVADGTQAGEGS